MKNDLKEMCDGCPWRIGALDGFMGPNTPQELVKQATSGSPSPCHMSVDFTNPMWKSEMSLAISDVQQCVGALAAATLLDVQPQSASARKQQDALTQEMIDECLHPAEFLELHEAAEVKSWMFTDGAGRIMPSAAGSVVVVSNTAPNTLNKK